MGKDAAEIRGEFHTCLNQIARELTGELYPSFVTLQPFSAIGPRGESRRPLSRRS